MRLVFHPEVYSDIDAIMRYYEQVATPELADRFYAEFVISWLKRPRHQNLFL
jgi:hypothetical protein